MEIWLDVGYCGKSKNIRLGIISSYIFLIKKAYLLVYLTEAVNISYGS